MSPTLVVLPNHSGLKSETIHCRVAPCMPTPFTFIGSDLIQSPHLNFHWRHKGCHPLDLPVPSTAMCFIPIQHLKHGLVSSMLLLPKTQFPFQCLGGIQGTTICLENAPEKGAFEELGRVYNGKWLAFSHKKNKNWSNRVHQFINIH